MDRLHSAGTVWREKEGEWQWMRSLWFSLVCLMSIDRWFNWSVFIPLYCSVWQWTRITHSQCIGTNRPLGKNAISVTSTQHKHKKGPNNHHDHEKKDLHDAGGWLRLCNLMRRNLRFLHFARLSCRHRKCFVFVVKIVHNRQSFLMDFDIIGSASLARWSAHFFVRLKLHITRRDEQDSVANHLLRVRVWLVEDIDEDGRNTHGVNLQLVSVVKKRNYFYLVGRLWSE